MTKDGLDGACTSAVKGASGSPKSDREEREQGRVTVHLAPRKDGGLRVWSDDEPGLILSGKDPAKVGADIWLAITALRKLRGATERKAG